MPYVNTEAMNNRLEEISKAVSSGVHTVLLHDGAGWHGSGDLVAPAITLPPYGPELNLVENVKEYLRENELAYRHYDTYEDIVEPCCEAWIALMATPEGVVSITQRSWAKVL
jgi:transposase